MTMTATHEILDRWGRRRQCPICGSEDQKHEHWDRGVYYDAATLTLKIQFDGPPPDILERYMTPARMKAMGQFEGEDTAPQTRRYAYRGQEYVAEEYVPTIVDRCMTPQRQKAMRWLEEKMGIDTAEKVDIGYQLNYLAERHAHEYEYRDLASKANRQKRETATLLARAMVKQHMPEFVEHTQLQLDEDKVIEQLEAYLLNNPKCGMEAAFAQFGSIIMKAAFNLMDLDPRI